MRRREFIGLAGGAAVAWPLRVLAQQQHVPVIGFLGATALDAYRPLVTSLRKALAENGFDESRNVTIEYRWAEGHYDRLPALAAELATAGVAIIFASSLPCALAAKKVTSTIPIVFVMGADPVKLGVVASLSRPGANVTGVYQYFGALGGKRLEIVRELLPSLAVLAILSNPKNPNAEDHLTDIQTAARTIGQQLDVLHASSENEIDTAFTNLVRNRDGALLVADDPLFSLRRDEIVSLAARYAIPTIYYAREFAVAGGLLSYGSSSVDNFYQAGRYTARILNGENPSDLPVLQPTSFELVINLKTARALNISVPQTLRTFADEVIE
jgi:putative ABC transport system substrate-binding protein